MKFSDSGFEVLKSIVTVPQINLISKEVLSSDIQNKKGGIRNADKKYQSIKNLVSSTKLISCANHYLSSAPKIVRVIFFDKTPENNWLVTWHQDKTVAVTEKFELNGWVNWSIKDGVHHVQPPLNILNNMITFRIHIDAANEKNGCLKVMPGSYKDGLLTQEEIYQYCSVNKSVNCVVEKGDILVMRPHLLHSSSKAETPSSRRIVHVEYSGYNLPKGITWA